MKPDSVRAQHLQAFGEEDKDHYKTKDINKRLHVVTQNYDENDRIITVAKNYVEFRTIQLNIL